MFLSRGFSKSGKELNERIPVEESIVNKEASSPPFKDHLTVSSALKSLIRKWGLFSLKLAMQFWSPNKVRPLPINGLVGISMFWE